MPEVVDRVLVALQRHLLSPEAVAAGVEAYRQERQQVARERARNEGALRRELVELERKIDRWVNAIGDGSIDAKAIVSKLNAAQARKDELEALLKATPRDDVAVLHPQAPSGTGARWRVCMMPSAAPIRQRARSWHSCVG